MRLRSFLPFFALALGMGLIGCSQGGKEKEKFVDTSAVRQHLEALSKSRILLGHQSVGRDLLAGLESLAVETGVPLRIVAIEGVPPDSEPGVFHSAIGENGNPDAKCEMFAQLLNRPERPAYDLAMMKFCYVDLEGDTSSKVDKMLDRYFRTVRDIREQRPDVQLVHITLPLQSDPPGKKTFVKRLLNRSTERDADNALRNAFNDGLRERYSGEPMFDLAAVESTLPDGSRSSFTHNGRTVYTLAQSYTHDGGHLNDAGKRRAAAEFARVLASALERRS